MHWGDFKYDGIEALGGGRYAHKYSSVLWDIPWGESWEEACSIMPATVKGVYFPHPTVCVKATVVDALNFLTLLVGVIPKVGTVGGAIVGAAALFFEVADIGALNMWGVFHIGFSRLRVTQGLTTDRALLSCTPDGSIVDLFNRDDNSGRQQWMLQRIGNSNEYHILVFDGVQGGKRYLSCTDDGTKVDLYHIDDGSGRQRWLLEEIEQGKYRIMISGGVWSGRRYLSCTPDGTKVDLYHIDDGSGRQHWTLW